MATYTEALKSIESVVTSFCHAYKKSTDDYSLYLEHALRCIQDFNLYDGGIPVTAKVTVNTTLKCIDMPTDMITFIDLVTPLDGQWWSFTNKANMVNTTTFTGGVEGRDDAQGEGHAITQSKTTTYGAKGGWNKFKYTLDWASRRIYVDDVYDTSNYFVLIYVSSGISTTGETKVPVFVVPLIDAYLLYVETFWIDSLIRSQETRFNKFWSEKRKIRDLINSMSESEWHDIFLSSTTQTIKR